jgi:hypothetical protein
MSTTDMVVALLPLALIAVTFLIFVRWLRAARARAEASLALSQAMVSELRAIRQTLQARDKETPPGS